MSDATTDDGATTAGDAIASEHVDVLIIGAGLSGIGAACHLTRRLPRKRYLVLEARETMGGTWDLFRYPGIRSDSDMFTLGFSFRPWTEARAIADGPSILRYLQETARDHGVDRHVRYQRRVTGLSWDSTTSRWTAEVADLAGGRTERITADFVYSCTGYYRYDEGYTPQFAGTDRFRGTIVHPQHWPEDLDPTGKRFVVIGSGATAVTLVPALAERAEHVVMLQRSPAYILSRPDRDGLADALRRWLPSRLAYGLVRWKNVLVSSGFYQLSRRLPGLVKRFLRARLDRQLPASFDTDTHFSPSYDPWDQRLCLVPDDDLFRALRRGSASVVTDAIDTFTATGLALRSGGTLEADVVVTATGLNLLMLGGMRIVVDGREVDPAATVAYKGCMLSGVPNLAFAVGYTNASWTLKVDLVSGYVCRLLDHLDRHGVDQAWPVPPAADQPLQPLIDLQAGYVLRALDQLPKQGTRTPWRLHQNYLRDLRLFTRGPIDDDGIRFVRRDDRVAIDRRGAVA